MAPSIKLAVFLLCTTPIYAKYVGGIAMAPFLNSTDGTNYCPAGTSRSGSAFCCPSGTSSDIYLYPASPACCPSSADCLQDLINSGIQCANPSWTLYNGGPPGQGKLLRCCPSSYFLDDSNLCINSSVTNPNFAAHTQYTSTPQANSLTVEGTFSSGVATGSGVITTATTSAAMTQQTPNSGGVNQPAQIGIGVGMGVGGAVAIAGILVFF